MEFSKRWGLDVAASWLFFKTKQETQSNISVFVFFFCSRVCMLGRRKNAKGRNEKHQRMFRRNLKKQKS